VTYARRESKAEKKERKRGLRFRVHSESAVATGSCSRNPPATTAASLCQLEVLRLPSLHHQKTRRPRRSEDQKTRSVGKLPQRAPQSAIHHRRGQHTWPTANDHFVVLGQLH